MKLWTKIGIGAALAMTGVAYALRMNRANAELVSMVTGKIHKLDATGITIRIDLQLKNPTQQKLKIAYPFIKLLYKGTVLGSTKLIKKSITIPAFGEVLIDKIMFNIPISGIFSIGMDVFKAIKNGDEIKVTIKTVSTIDLTFKKIPYKDEKQIVILKKKKKDAKMISKSDNTNENKIDNDNENSEDLWKQAPKET
jgi:hypothetical protein